MTDLGDNTRDTESPNTGEPLDAQRLTWAALLGRWVDFARSAIALPSGGAEGRLRGSVADIIQLQAVWFALENLGELDAPQRALGLDRAGLLIERHATAIESRWGEAPMPDTLRELIEDCRKNLRDQRVAQTHTS